MDVFHPVQLLADWLTYTALHVVPDTALASAVNFFLFDTIKIFLLLGGIIYVMSIVRSFVPPERIRDILSHNNRYAGHVVAALLGTITPFCSCSAVPLFLGFLQAGVPLGATFSFLVASPMVNEVALVLLGGMFGWHIAAIYVVSGLSIAILAGIAIGSLRVENLLEPFAYRNAANAVTVELPSRSWSERSAEARAYTGEIIRTIWPYVVVGIGLGAWLHGYVPTGLLATYAGADRWYAVPLAVLVGIPLYSNAAGVIPLVSVLAEKGVAMGTTLAFMMAVTALSLPEFMILKRVMKVRLMLLFAGVVAVGILFTGYLFNLLL